MRTGHLAAIKAIGADKITQDKILQSLQSEINILRSVVHPNIVKLLDYERREVREAPCAYAGPALDLHARCYPTRFTSPISYLTIDFISLRWCFRSSAKG